MDGAARKAGVGVTPLDVSLGVLACPGVPAVSLPHQGTFFTGLKMLQLVWSQPLTKESLAVSPLHTAIQRVQICLPGQAGPSLRLSQASYTRWQLILDSLRFPSIRNKGLIPLGN